jgi:PBP1b-binding outer membrane lipoprotein LpoB
MIQRVTMTGVVALLLAGCNTSTPPTVAPPKAQAVPSIPTEVTLYLPGMNESMQIL